MTIHKRFAIALIFAAAMPVAVQAADGQACSAAAGIVLGARTPEVDLFDAASGGKRVSSVAKDKFPTCLPILEQSPARMLKIEIGGVQYWVQPHMVTFRAADAKAPVCRALAGNTDEAKTGSTRGLGEGC